MLCRVLLTLRASAIWMMPDMSLPKYVRLFCFKLKNKAVLRQRALTV